MPKFSNRSLSVPSPPLSKFYKIAKDLEKQGVEIIDFGQSGADIHLPNEILNKFKKMVTNRVLYEYSRPEGLPEIRELVSLKLREDNNVVYNPNEIIITAGANLASFISIAAVADPGDEIIIVSPHYFDHEYAAYALNVKPIFVNMNEEDGRFYLNIESLRKAITEKTKAILINYPNNPTGFTFDEKTLKGIADVAIKNDLFVISDEAYEYFIYEGKHVSIASLSEMKERTIMIGSFSKSFGMAGWRAGYIASSEDVIEKILRFQDITTICAPLPSQILLSIILPNRHPLVDEYIDRLRKRRNFIFMRLNELPWMSVSKPPSGIFLFPKIENCSDSMKLSMNLLEKLGLITVPGSLFGRAGEGHLRFSFGKTPISEISEGIDRLEEELKEIPC